MPYSRILHLLLGLVFLLGSTVAAAQKSVDGTIVIDTASIALGVGVEWGEGTLTLDNGTQYKFTLQGLEVGGVGVAQVRATGDVYNLDSVSEFPGIYVAAEANVTVLRGPGARTMRNEPGVVIHLASVQEGTKLTLAAEGVRIRLKQ
jgi:hypothetical protein